MMKFEVSGATPEEFAQNTMQAFAVLTIGLQNLAQAAKEAQASDVNPYGAAQPPSTPQSSTPPSVLAPEQSNTDIPTMEPLENPKLSELTAAAPKTTTTFKPEQIKDRLAEAVLAHGTVAGRALLAAVGAKKITEVDTDEKRAAFMRASEEYLLTGDRADLDDAIPF